MSDEDLVYLSAAELRERYRRRELSPVEVVEATLRRIEQLDPSVHAFMTVTSELARAQAKEAEKSFTVGDDDRTLLGIPVSIKDLNVTKGIRTTLGSLVHQDWVPDFDELVVERIRAAGAVLIGKTSAPEQGWKYDTSNRIVGITHNPWKHGRSAGGSSGGAAAAVASGMGSLALAGDGGGSIRVPASFCGVVGYKPSFGLIPVFPSYGLGDLVVQHGPITRTVADAALLLSVLAGPDPRDRFSYGGDSRGLDPIEEWNGGLRVAWSPDLGFAQVEPEIADIAAGAAQLFRELGCTVEEVTPELEDPTPINNVLFQVYLAEEPDFERVRDDLDQDRVPLIEQGLQLSGLEVAAAVGNAASWAERMRHFMEPYDLLLTPSVPIRPFEAGRGGPGEPPVGPWATLSVPFNFTGQPAVTVPCGFTADGLPTGLQIVGRWREDRTVLSAAAAFEAIRPWAHLRPNLMDDRPEKES